MISSNQVDVRAPGPELSLRPVFPCPAVQTGRTMMDPITDLFLTTQVASVVHARLEATAPVGPQKRSKCRRRYRKRSCSAGDLPLTACPFRKWLAAASAGSASRAFLMRCRSQEGTASCWPPEAHTRSAIIPGHSRAASARVAPKERSQLIQYGGGGAPTTIVSGVVSIRADERQNPEAFTSIAHSCAGR